MHQSTNVCTRCVRSTAHVSTTNNVMHVTIQVHRINHLQLNVFCPLQPYGHLMASESQNDQQEPIKCINIFTARVRIKRTQTRHQAIHSIFTFCQQLNCQNCTPLKTIAAPTKKQLGNSKGIQPLRSLALTIPKKILLGTSLTGVTPYKQVS